MKNRFTNIVPAEDTENFQVFRRDFLRTLGGLVVGSLCPTPLLGSIKEPPLQELVQEKLSSFSEFERLLRDSIAPCILDLSFEELDVIPTDSLADLALILASQFQHVVVHIHAQDSPFGADDLRSDIADLSATHTKIQHPAALRFCRQALSSPQSAIHSGGG